MKNVLRALLLTGIVGATAAAAQAQVAVYAGVGPVAAYGQEYVPPCPGAGFYWTSGHYAGQVWVPGRWLRHDGYRGPVAVYHRDFDRGPVAYDHRGYDRRGHDRR